MTQDMQSHTDSQLQTFLSGLLESGALGQDVLGLTSPGGSSLTQVKLNPINLDGNEVQVLLSLSNMHKLGEKDLIPFLRLLATELQSVTDSIFSTLPPME